MKLQDIHIRDPFVMVVDGHYYLYGSRGPETWGKCTGLDVYVSDDLEDWSEPVEVFNGTKDFWSDTNYWAPEVHKYQGSYYMFASFISDTRRRGTQILKADSPMGPFRPHSDGPVTPAEWECLDGTLYVENGKPYIIFCHEWSQIRDGEMCAMELTPDLKEPAGAPILLFKASEPSWSTGLGNPEEQPEKEKRSYVTDGPFMYRTAGGRLLMIWSSFSQGEYCEGIAYSDNGSVTGKWQHDDRLLFAKDGGHGMLFRDKDNVLKFICHQPNVSPLERPVVVEILEGDDTLYVKTREGAKE